MKAIQPFTFDSSIDVPSPNYDLMKLNNIYNKTTYEPKPSIDISSNPISTNSNNIVSVDIDKDNKEKPFGLKFDLFFVDIEVYPRFDKIFNFIGHLF